jgi:hypothetical protein
MQLDGFRNVNCLVHQTLDASLFVLIIPALVFFLSDFNPIYHAIDECGFILKRQLLWVVILETQISPPSNIGDRFQQKVARRPISLWDPILPRTHRFWHHLNGLSL